ncbi:hypothetical protein DW954_00345 [Clostridium sp. AM45-5]|nr:hypothetical protein DW954_00345 [Clostridium sp. AM45-5]
MTGPAVRNSVSGPDTGKVHFLYRKWTFAFFPCCGADREYSGLYPFVCQTVFFQLFQNPAESILPIDL